MIGRMETAYKGRRGPIMAGQGKEAALGLLGPPGAFCSAFMAYSAGA